MIYQISVFVENKPGRLCEITGVLAERAIDIRAFSIADTTDFGILRLIVNDPDSAVAALKATGVTVMKTEVLAVRIDDTPGSLHNVLEMLRTEGVSVEYAYAFITRSHDDAYVILRTETPETAVGVLKRHNVPMLTSAEVYSV